MKVMWLCNTTVSAVARARGESVPGNAGWLSGAADALVQCEDIELCICFPQLQSEQPLVGTVDQLSYFGFPASKRPPHEYDPALEGWFQKAIAQFKPDLVHIWGTEYPHTLAMTKAYACPEKTIISIQGLCSVYAEHYMAHLPEHVRQSTTFRDLLRRDNLRQQQEKFRLRGGFEQEALTQAGHIIGRTRWDRACALQIAPQAKYHFCNETLRSSFYAHAGTWSQTECERHSVFVSQASYPIKGFHLALQAAAILKAQYPDIKVYTTGPDPRKIKAYKVSGYQRHLIEQIERLGLQESIVFTGFLSEEEMCARYLRANVFVSASSIENSPNSVGEAMMLGVPVAASYVGGTMDLLHEGEGILYQADAPYMLADAIHRVFADGEAAAQMGKWASAHALRTHDAQRNQQALVGIYRSVYAKED